MRIITGGQLSKVPTLYGIEDYNPVEEDAVLWRYMDPPRFLALLFEKALHFSSKGEFKDLWEGTIPQPVIDLVESNASRLGVDPGPLVENMKDLASRGCILCWFGSLHESVPMWKYYGAGGIAVKTTAKALWKSLSLDSDRLRIARIQYVEHGEHDFGSSGYSMLGPLFLKQHGWECEQEVRAVVLPVDESRSGVELPVGLTSLVERIVVSPEYPTWGIPALRKVVELAGLSVPIEISTLSAKPPH